MRGVMRCVVSNQRIFYVLKGRFHNIKRWCGEVYKVPFFKNIRRQHKHSFLCCLYRRFQAITVGRNYQKKCFERVIRFFIDNFRRCLQNKPFWKTTKNHRLCPLCSGTVIIFLHKINIFLTRYFRVQNDTTSTGIEFKKKEVIANQD